jgi:hypothetical protein
MTPIAVWPFQVDTLALLPCHALLPKKPLLLRTTFAQIVQSEIKVVVRIAVSDQLRFHYIALSVVQRGENLWE